ncbi:MAG: A24 family peptidase [Gammaproteobacteria bacterium]|nr:A24 family peptidase [Gammaproteobacteria bacterium]
MIAEQVIASGEQLLAYGWAGIFIALWMSLAVGSFLNVVIYRLPVMLERQWQGQAREVLELPAPAEEPEPFNLMVPRSRCPGCGNLISAWQNIPIFSWIFLRGRCGSCGTGISTRYPIVELLTALCSLTVLALFGYTWLGLAALLYTWALIALTFIDYDTQLLPDQITLPLMWLGLLTNLLGGVTDLGSAMFGAVIGYLFLWGTYWAFKLITGKEGMGYGDFKLFAAIGAWLGWQLLPATILIASAAGLLYALVITVAGKRQRAQPIPFGPFLAVAGWVSLVARDNVLSLFLP